VAWLGLLPGRHDTLLTGFIPVLGTDWREDVVILVAAALVTVAAFVLIPSLDGQARFLFRDTGAYLGGDGGAADITFTEEQVDMLNRVNEPSLGNAIADERLYCGQLRDGEVLNVDLVHDITESSVRSIAGECKSRFGPTDFTLHTHPNGDTALSEEDKSGVAGLDFVCVQADEIAVSPVSGEIGGVQCYDTDDFSRETLAVSRDNF